MRVRNICLMTLCILFLNNCTLDVNAITSAPASENGYSVELNGDGALFICNRETIGNEVGTQYYMTYTVENISATSIDQTGVIGTNYPDAHYPYGPDLPYGGIYHYNWKWSGDSDILMREGRTYVLKFTVTDMGYDYEVAYIKDGSSNPRYFELLTVTGETGNPEYFGLFIASSELTGKLSNVHCYDVNGNDLGVRVREDAAAKVSIVEKSPIEREANLPKDNNEKGKSIRKIYYIAGVSILLGVIILIVIILRKISYFHMK